MSLIVIIAAGVVITFIVKNLLYKSNKSVNDVLHKIPGPKGIPLLGNIEMGIQSNENILKLFTKYINLYGRRYKFNLGPVTVVVISNARDAEKIMSSSVHIGKSQDYVKFYSMWLGYGLLTSSGQKWQSRRKLLTPAFHFKILEDFLPVINHHSQALVKRLEAFHSDSTSSSFDIYPVIAQSALHVICETAMGLRLDSTKESHMNYVSHVNKVNELLMRRVFSPWLHPEFAWKISPTGKAAKSLINKTHGFTIDVINKRKAEQLSSVGEKDSSKKDDRKDDDAVLRIGKDRKRRAFLDLLLETQRDFPSLMSDEDIREEVDTFMFEGHDTTSSCLNWTIYLLGTYQDVQQKVYEELQDIFGNDKERTPTMEDLSKMKYMEMCIKESLRIYSTVPFIGRELTEECRLDSETVLPPKTTVWLHLYFIHKDPSVYPDPLVFDPQRFATDESIDRSPFSFLPFSAGPRNCIGQRFAMMEMKSILASVFRRFRITSVEPRDQIKVLCEAIMKPKNGVEVQLHRRF